jgi:hypothetical protein
MADSGGVSDLMAEVGGTLGIAETIELPEGAGWYVSTSTGAALALTYDPDADQLNFHSRLGRPEPTLREPTYGLLLAYNITVGARKREAAGSGSMSRVVRRSCALRHPRPPWMPTRCAG